MFSEYFAVDKKQNPLLVSDSLDKEIVRLPPPPRGLPRPWMGDVWRASYFWTILIISIITIIIRIQFPQFIDNLTLIYFWICNTWAGLGVLLFGVWSLKSNIVNHIQSQLGIVKRYRRKTVSEGLFVPRHKFSIDSKSYFLYFYIPGDSGVNVSRLAKGAEPLLFDSTLRWVDDETLFHKAALLWAYMLEFSPQTMGNYRIYGYNMMRRNLTRHFSRLPWLLRQNLMVLVQKGLANEVELVLASLPVKCGYYRATLDKELAMIAWGDGYGWDSGTELRYEDILLLHDGQSAFQASVRKFYETHRLSQAEEAASKIIAILTTSGSSGWWMKDSLLKALTFFAAPYNPPEEPIHRIDGEWRAPEIFLEGYRLRVAWAREVDAARSEKIQKA